MLLCVWRIVSMWRPPFVLAVIAAWHMHTSWFGSLITLTNDLCLFFVCLYLDLDVDVAAAAAVAAALHVLQDTDVHEERESSALPSLRRAPPRRSSRRRVSTPSPTPQVGGRGAPRNCAHARGSGPARRPFFLRPPSPVAGVWNRRARAHRLISGGGRASAADRLCRQRPFLLALPPLPPKDTTATESRGSSAVYFFFSARVAIDGSFPTAPSSARTCNDYALAAVRQSGSGILRRFPLASTPSQRSTRGLPVMASTLVPCTFTFVFTR